jgi:hypothetical protein
MKFLLLSDENNEFGFTDDPAGAPRGIAVAVMISIAIILLVAAIHWIV